MEYIKESIREDDWVYLSACGEEEELKSKIEAVAVGLHKAMTQRSIDTIVAHNALITLLGTYTARMSNGDAVAVDEMCDSSSDLIKRHALEAYKNIYNWKDK